MQRTPVIDPPSGDDPQVMALAHRYAGHPAAPSQWDAAALAREPVLPAFRSDAAYMRQLGTESEYRVTYDYMRRYDRLGLADRLDDDGAFGARGCRFDGRLWTRDLLDSISELNFLADELPDIADGALSILDIGAGYGRFAHRCRVALPRSRLTLCDAVPLSTALCRFYLAYRRIGAAEVIPLDLVETALHAQLFDLAVSIHAFNEMPAAAVGWWLGQLARLNVPFLFLVPNDVQGLRTYEADGSRLPFDRFLCEAGYVLQVARDKYRYDATAQRDGLYPGMYMIYLRHPERVRAPNGRWRQTGAGQT